jgi:dsRNA-specific ribonuclease
MAEDAFAEALENREDLSWVRRGLTDESYKKYVNDNVPGHSNDNFELATLGDSLLKFTLNLILLDTKPKLTEARKDYETDEVLVRVIGRHYHIVDYMYFDRNDANIARDYGWMPDAEPRKKKNEDPPHKHIATAVEGALGGLYMQHRDFAEIKAIVEKWISLIDAENKVSEAVRHPGY